MSFPRHDLRTLLLWASWYPAREAFIERLTNPTLWDEVDEDLVKTLLRILEHNPRYHPARALAELFTFVGG